MGGTTSAKFSKLLASSSVAVILMLLAVIFTVDLIAPRGTGFGFLYVLPLFLTLWWTKKETYICVILSSVLLVVGFVLSPPGSALWLSVVHRAVSLVFAWSMVVLIIARKNHEEEKERAIIEREKTLDEVKILRGLLPICASCKKIRDDKGYWTQIESYIANHSEAQFTHGLCPDCAKKLYPKFFQEDTGSEGS